MRNATGDDRAFVERLRQSLADGSFVRLSLARPHDAEPSLQRLLARRVVLRGEDRLSLVWRHRSRDVTKNLPPAEAIEAIAALIDSQFHHAHLVTRSHDVQLAPDRKGRWRLRVGRQAAPVDAPGPAAHDREKQHPLSLAAPFLAELGITDDRAQLVPSMARKWRQINKFVEILAHAIDASPLAGRDASEPVRVVDFGAGKGYLTFAVHQHLQSVGRQPAVTGVELREDLVAQGNDAAARLALPGLRFVTGDLHSPTDGEIDLLIALHACDTATDLAMHRGIAGGAAIIVCSPCCHKQLRPQITAPAPLRPMLRHGIHLTEQAEMLTDTLRALLLQSAGYDTRVFEFIAPEHTHRNKMVLAVRRQQVEDAAQRESQLAQVAELKAYYGVTEQALEQLLAADRG